MAITINGTGSITGLTAGGLPDGSVTSADLASGAITAGALPNGSILQVVSTTKSDTFSTSSTDFVDVTGLSVSITPSSTSNKILVLVNLTGDGTAGDTRAVYRLVRGSTVIAQGDAAGSRPRGFGGIYHPSDTNTVESISAVHLDSPASTSEQTYKVQASEGNNTASSVYVNRASSWADAAGHVATISTITVMEVAA
jgi:hypothetical protein